MFCIEITSFAFAKEQVKEMHFCYSLLFTCVPILKKKKKKLIFMPFRESLAVYAILTVYICIVSQFATSETFKTFSNTELVA